MKTGGVFRKEDIQLASSQPVNKGWGPKGADTYDILKYKGGGDCHHFWQRKVYLKKSNKYITIANAQKLLKELGVKVEIPTSGEPLSTVKPMNMVNRGFLTPRK
jgi:ribose 5-phosphate isomerase